MSRRRRRFFLRQTSAVVTDPLTITKSIIEIFGGFLWLASEGVDTSTAEPDVDAWEEVTDPTTNGSFTQAVAANKPHLDTSDPDGPLIDFDRATAIDQLRSDKVGASPPNTNPTPFDFITADTGGRLIFIFKQKRTSGGSLVNFNYANQDGIVVNQAAGLIAAAMYRNTVFEWQVITPAHFTLNQLAMLDIHFSDANGAGVQVDDNTKQTTLYSAHEAENPVQDFYMNPDAAIAAIIGIGTDISAEDAEALRWELSQAFPIAGTYPISEGNPRLVL